MAGNKHMLKTQNATTVVFELHCALVARSQADDFSYPGFRVLIKTQIRVIGVLIVKLNNTTWHDVTGVIPTKE